MTIYNYFLAFCDFLAQLENSCLRSLMGLCQVTAQTSIIRRPRQTGSRSCQGCKGPYLEVNEILLVIAIISPVQT